MCDASTTRAGGDLSRLRHAFCRASTQPLSVAVIGDLACGEFPAALSRLSKFNVHPVCVQYDSHNPPATRALASLPKSLDLALLGLPDDVRPPHLARNVTSLLRPHEELVRALLALPRAPAVVYVERPPAITTTGAAAAASGGLSAALHRWVTLSYRLPTLRVPAACKADDAQLVKLFEEAYFSARWLLPPGATCAQLQAAPPPEWLPMRRRADVSSS